MIVLMITHKHECMKSDHFHFIFRSVHWVLYVDLNFLNLAVAYLRPQGRRQMHPKDKVLPTDLRPICTHFAYNVTIVIYNIDYFYLDKYLIK
jgi:hypothetical protein